jgi:uncharacterized membrane-anchored protein
MSPEGSSPAAVSGTARVDTRTKRLVPRLKPGNIAIIDHEDLDLVAAESLLEHGAAAVVNTRRSISGRYPNLGPLVLVRAGVPILDDVGPDVLRAVGEGDLVTVDGERLLTADGVVARGVLLDEESVLSKMDAARTTLSAAVEQFTENTLEYVRQEQELLLESARLEGVHTSFAGRHALVVTRGYHYKEDLRALRMYIREMHPVIVAVDGAADACLAEGITPDVIVGDMDSVTTTALLCGAELFVHPPGDWRRGLVDGIDQQEPEAVKKVRALGVDCHVITTNGTSEDVAMLLAHEQGAELIVTVGSHTSMVEFLDKGRKGMASTFLVRLRLGPMLVDAKGVSQLYRTRVAARDLTLLVLAAFVTMAIVSVISPPGRLFWAAAWELIKQSVFTIRNWF